jgi:hypothetical protein
LERRIRRLVNLVSGIKVPNDGYARAAHGCIV